MSLYDTYILPHVINLAMRNRDLKAYRQRIISAAEGRVLEIGIGSGLNLPFYGSAVQEVLGLEPVPRLIAMAQPQTARCAAPVRFIEASAESIPIDSHSIDTAVTTWTLCSIPQATVALQEMRRVLKRGGRLLFVEHGRSPDERVRIWQDRLTPAWKCIGGGCHLNRPIQELIERAGFSIVQLQTGYMKGPKPMTFMYEGRATPQ
jgi:ubiquinone/menaquinone biosynthesis C-methylase UbiE